MASLDNVLDAAELDLLMGWALALVAFSPDCVMLGGFMVVMVVVVVGNWGVGVGVCACRGAGAGLDV
jgi:hypothetical protein